MLTFEQNPSMGITTTASVVIHDHGNHSTVTAAGGDLDPSPEYSYHTHHSTGKLEEADRIRQALHLSSGVTLLWEALDRGRAGMHAKAIQNAFLQGLTHDDGQFCQTAFMKYLVNLLTIHQALESAQEELAKIERLQGFVMCELFRSESIKNDLTIWQAVSDPKTWNSCQEARDYAAYIRATAQTDPERIVAIMYTLYGTVMSGGQRNKGVVQKKLGFLRECMDGIPQGSGVAFYEICRNGAVLDGQGIASFKQEWHQRLCAIQAQEHNASSAEAFHCKLIAECSAVFEKILEIINKDVLGGHC